MIGDQPDGENINLHCGSTQIDALRQLVLKQHLDVGFAFDGDADRCIAVDHLGEVADGDAILYVMACALRERGRLRGNKVVTTVMSNMGLYEALEAQGIGCEQTYVGDKYVSERMRKNGFSLGGEQSGHVIFGELAGTGDGLLTALQLTDRMIETGLPLRELRQGYRAYPQLLRSMPLRAKNALVQDADLWEWVQTLGETLGSTGRVLVRPSGTEPLVRVMAETKDRALCAEIVERVVAELDKRGYLT